MLSEFQYGVDFLLGTWRVRWWAIASAWVVCVIGWPIVLAQPDVYLAAAKVQVETESMLRPLLRGLAIDKGVMTAADVMKRMVLSRSQLEQVVKDVQTSAAAISPGEIDAIIAELREEVLIEADRDETYTIQYQHTSRSTALSVVDSLLNQLINNALRPSAVLNSAGDFLERRVAKQQQRMREAAQRLAEFNSKNIGRMPVSAGGYYDRLLEHRFRLDETDAELTVAINRRNELLRQLEGEEPVFGLSPMPFMQRSSFDEKIEEYEARLAELNLRFTERHPDSVRIQEILDDLYERRDIERENQKNRGYSYSLDTNPVYQTIRVALSRSDLEIAELQTRKRQQQKELNRLKNMVDTSPKIETELKQLQREYELASSQYDTFLARLETARLSEDIEQSGPELQLRVIEPVNVSNKSVGPARTLEIATVLAGGLALGLGAMLLVQLVSPVVSTRFMVNGITNLPVIGVIPEVIPPELVWRHRVTNFAFLMSIFSLFLAFFALEIWQQPASAFAQVIAANTSL